MGEPGPQRRNVTQVIFSALSIVRFSVEIAGEEVLLPMAGRSQCPGPYSEEPGSQWMQGCIGPSANASLPGSGTQWIVVTDLVPQIPVPISADLPATLS